MKFAIICSKKDTAGMNIRENLLKDYPFKKTKEKYQSNEIYELNNAKLYTVEEESVDQEDIDKDIKADLFIFATRHQSSSGVASFSVHVQGNWGNADFGGKEAQLAIAPAAYLKSGLLKLEELAKETKQEVIQEVTHHGPYMETPSMFIEIGSSEEQWKDKKLGKKLAKAVYYLITEKPPKVRAAFGIGGPHHTPEFKKIVKSTEIAFGHICPKYNLDNLTKEMIKQAIEKTKEKVEIIILDWKGLGQYKEKVTNLLKELNLDYKKTKELK